jgi:uncharacterized phage infection (PIP) family protein YhgE
MGIKFSFFAYGILALAALLFFLYFLGQTSQFQVSNEALTPLLYLGGFIVVAFIIYMFAKLAKR